MNSFFRDLNTAFSDLWLLQDDGPTAIERLVGADVLREKFLEFVVWCESQVLTIDVAIQGVVIFAAIACAAYFGPRLKALLHTKVAPRAPIGILRRACGALARIATPIALFVVLQLSALALRGGGIGTVFISSAASLLIAWIAIRLVTMIIRSPFWSQVAAYVVWPIAALEVFGFLDDVVAQLSAFSVPLGTDENGIDQTLSALDVIRTLAIFAVLFWATSAAGSFIKGRIGKIDELTISFKALLGKILDVLLPIIALIAALQIVGFPFGTLAIFGGAVGLGLGLGMQRTISNFFAGFTLIADKSIKPGDVIQVSDTFGWVTQMNARYVSLRTRDGTAHLVPNDKFIEEGVINWSHSDHIVRLHAPFGVAYSTPDLRDIVKSAQETAVSIDRVLSSPAPRCNVMAFGDHAVEFDLRFWVNDPANGVSNVRSEVYLALWDMLARKGVEIPYPQRDLHIKSLPSGSDIDALAGGVIEKRENASISADDSAAAQVSMRTGTDTNGLT